MTAESRVTNRQQLFQQVERMLKQFGGAATVEQFIDGPEYSVLVVENPDDRNDPVVFTPVQCFFSNGHTFKHFDLKWTDCDSVKHRPVTDQTLARDLIDASKRVFLACGGDGYIRCDFRVDSRTGVIYFLELNTNPSVFYEEHLSAADHILEVDPIGFDGFIRLIIKAALKRKEMTTPKVRIEYDPARDFYLVAAADIGQGERIYSEEIATLTSGKYVREHWTEQRDPMRKSWFQKYAFLIGPDVYRTWHDNPDKWQPINHSCDPNTWICYDVFVHARKFIKKGEEITIDYGTFGVIEGADNKFECRCGTSNCRGVVRPSSDYKLPGFRKRYKDHLSSYVESLLEKCDSET